jgi:hypothetical protein
VLVYVPICAVTVRYSIYIRLGVASGLVLNYMHCVLTHGQSDGRIKLSIQYQEDDISLCRNHTHISFPWCSRQCDVSDFVHKGVLRV